MKSKERSSISDLFRSRQDDLKKRIGTFIARKYDIMVDKLQFADSIAQDFQSVGAIVNFICKNMAHGENDSYKILIPVSVKDAMKNSLNVRDCKSILYIIVNSLISLADELKSLLDENGLRKILSVVRSELRGVAVAEAPL